MNHLNWLLRSLHMHLHEMITKGVDGTAFREGHCAERTAISRAMNAPAAIR